MVDKVQPGDPIRAATFNELVGLHQRQPTRHGGPGVSGQTIGVVAVAVNSGATTLDPFSVALIVGQPHPIAASPHERPQITAEVELPSAAVNIDFIAIPQEQILAGNMGRVCLQGICWAKYDGSTGDRGSAVEGSDELTLSDTGPAEILWENATDGLVLIRFGGGGSGGEVIAHSHTTENWGFVPSWFGN